MHVIDGAKNGISGIEIEISGLDKTAQSGMRN